MNVAFWDNQLDERGTAVSLYDYAYYNQTILGNNSFIFYDKHRKHNPEIVKKFKSMFVVHDTDDFKEVDDYLLQYNITHIYIIKGGEKNTRISKVAKNCIHCVFNCYHPHGHVYSCISSVVSGYNDTIPVVPHMVNLPINTLDMREELNIPNNAVVFGGYGGASSFNIPFVHEVVFTTALQNPHIYFLFANFNRFCPKLPNIIHMSTITDLDEKVKFINTTDAMLWGRQDGETFGVSIAEFSSLNKPIICTKIGFLNHVRILGEKAFYYNDAQSLSNILINFNPENEKHKDWNAYKDYTPEKVMQIFKRVYLD
jgi:hypothetical protein